ncbi:predicted protein [Sclerotinia sclerotiorum 1980 UF-70]|uniref:Uncharacterized protein n=1 Tax=Sclerotinia sclerotiorum (strain ATCC 18683 / 1980 / Ss-1) TaxID=665079 RepID=A7F8W4_SCLS1|nr:predicted protein [Sclerotinia sclerotiorum 1980 UF-70]EDN99185.1 predicted protein [Sclerotinia sclerotiorum 1980 UF-70]
MGLLRSQGITSKKGVFYRIEGKEEFCSFLSSFVSYFIVRDIQVPWDPSDADFLEGALWLSKKIQRSVTSLVDTKVRAFAAPTIVVVTSAFISNEKE